MRILIETKRTPSVAEAAQILGGMSLVREGLVIIGNGGGHEFMTNLTNSLKSTPLFPKAIVEAPIPGEFLVGVEMWLASQETGIDQFVNFDGAWALQPILASAPVSGGFNLVSLQRGSLEARVEEGLESVGKWFGRLLGAAHGLLGDERGAAHFEETIREIVDEASHENGKGRVVGTAVVIAGSSSLRRALRASDARRITIGEGGHGRAEFPRY